MRWPMGAGGGAQQRFWYRAIRNRIAIVLDAAMSVGCCTRSVLYVGDGGYGKIDTFEETFWMNTDF